MIITKCHCGLWAPLRRYNAVGEPGACELSGLGSGWGTILGGPDRIESQDDVAIGRAVIPCYVADMEPIYSDHTRLDERSLALHQLVAKKLLADPRLLDRARANVRRWQESNGSPSLALAEWEQILTGPAEEIARLLVERSEAATRLRQSTPFTGILTEPERLAIYESYSARAYHPGRQPNIG